MGGGGTVFVPSQGGNVAIGVSRTEKDLSKNKLKKLRKAFEGVDNDAIRQAHWDCEGDEIRMTEVLSEKMYELVRQQRGDVIEICKPVIEKKRLGDPNFLIGYVLAKTAHPKSPLFCFIVVVEYANASYKQGQIIRPIPVLRFEETLDEKGHFWKMCSEKSTGGKGKGRRTDPNVGDRVVIEFYPEDTAEHTKSGHAYGNSPHRNEDCLATECKVVTRLGMENCDFLKWWIPRNCINNIEDQWPWGTSVLGKFTNVDPDKSIWMVNKEAVNYPSVILLKVSGEKHQRNPVKFAFRNAETSEKFSVSFGGGAPGRMITDVPLTELFNAWGEKCTTNPLDLSKEFDRNMREGDMYFVIGLARAEMCAPDGNRVTESSMDIKKLAQAGTATKAQMFFQYCQLLLIGRLGPFPLNVRPPQPPRCRPINPLSQNLRSDPVAADPPVVNDHPVNDNDGVDGTGEAKANSWYRFEDDERPTCPLCIEELDATDRYFFPCPCGYQVCLYCVRNILDNINGLCPACRHPYDEDNFRLDEDQRSADLKRDEQRFYEAPVLDKGHRKGSKGDGHLVSGCLAKSKGKGDVQNGVLAKGKGKGDFVNGGMAKSKGKGDFAKGSKGGKSFGKGLPQFVPPPLAEYTAKGFSKGGKSFGKGSPLAEYAAPLQWGRGKGSAIMPPQYLAPPPSKSTTDQPAQSLNPDAMEFQPMSAQRQAITSKGQGKGDSMSKGKGKGKSAIPPSTNASSASIAPPRRSEPEAEPAGILQTIHSHDWKPIPEWQPTLTLRTEVTRNAHPVSGRPQVRHTEPSSPRENVPKKIPKKPAVKAKAEASKAKPKAESSKKKTKVTPKSKPTKAEKENARPSQQVDLSQGQLCQLCGFRSSDEKKFKDHFGTRQHLDELTKVANAGSECGSW